MLQSTSNSPHAPPSMHSFDVERAAHALRHKLALATSHIHSPRSLTAQQLTDNNNGTRTASDAVTSASSADASRQSTMSPSSTHTSVSGETDITANNMHGLGIGMVPEAAEKGAIRRRVTLDAIDVSFAPQITTPSPRALGRGPHPSLYDVIFGPSLGRLTLPRGAASLQAAGQAVTSSTTSGQQQRRSPHVRQGSSAFLEQVALSPRLSSAHDFADTSTGSRPHFNALHHTPTMSSLDDSLSIRPYTSDEPCRATLPHSFRLGAAELQGEKRSASDLQSAAMIESAEHPQPRGDTSSHKRMRSLGGSVLPNGRPASSLAQDLGLASGGTGRMPRTRIVSATSALAAPHHVAARDAQQGEQAEDPETLVGYLLAGLASSPPRSTSSPSSTFDRGSSAADFHSMPARTSTSTFIDPNFVTPRKRLRSSNGYADSLASPSSSSSRRASVPRSPYQDMDEVDESRSGVDDVGDCNEDAAHSLLDLAASPSLSDPRGRFVGLTPSLRSDEMVSARRLSAAGRTGYRVTDSIDRYEEISRKDGNDPAVQLHPFNTPPQSVVVQAERKAGLLAASSLCVNEDRDAPPRQESAHTAISSSPALHPSTPPSNGRRSHARTPSHLGRVRLVSPPFTPPPSDDVHAADKTEQGCRFDRHVGSSPPDSPSRRRPLAEQTLFYGSDAMSGLQAAGDAHDRLPITPIREKADPLQQRQAPIPADGTHSAALPVETPRTPPPMASTPQTPKAPGSNFSYGDFLHVSPSPKPGRMRGAGQHELDTPASSATLPLAAAVLGHAASQTPTRGIHSRARFAEPDDCIVGEESDEDDDLLGRSTGMFTVGPLPARQRPSTALNKGMLGSALNLREPTSSRSIGANDDEDLMPGKPAPLALQATPSDVQKSMGAQDSQ